MNAILIERNYEGRVFRHVEIMKEGYPEYYYLVHDWNFATDQFRKSKVRFDTITEATEAFYTGTVSWGPWEPAGPR